MTVRPRLLAPLAVLAGSLAFTAPSAVAHPEVCDASKAAGGAFTSTFFSFAGPGEEGEKCFTAQQIATFDDSAATLETGESANSKNLKLLANRPKTGPMAGDRNYNSDIAFQDNFAYQGNYNGFQVTDISDPGSPTVISQMLCPGAQNDISVYGDLLVTSTDSTRNFAECVGADGTPNVPRPTSAPADTTWEGIRVFDISNPASPRYVTAVETPCGSHTHTLVPDGDQLVVYVSSYNPASSFPKCQPPHDLISVVTIPTASPADAELASTPVLFPDGGNPPGNYSRATAGCHDITVYPAKDIAAGACMGQGILMDISDPMNPIVTDTVYDRTNMAFWHSATFTPDGSAVLFTDELGGGGGPTCNPTTGAEKGANTVYRVEPGKQLGDHVGYFKIPRTQKNSENCVAHNGMFLPTDKGLYYVQAWYQGGTSIIDYNDLANPKEIAFFERGPFKDVPISGSSLGGAWSSYWYRGKIYVSDIQMGLDVLNFSGPQKAGVGATERRLNAQVQDLPRK